MPQYLLGNLSHKADAGHESSWSASLQGILVILVCTCGQRVYRLFFHRLSAFPGPRLAAFTLWYKAFYDIVMDGAWSDHLTVLHATYGPVVRVAPNEVHDNVSNLAVYTPKSYGKSIKPVDLPDGISRFFPVGSPISDEGQEVSKTSTSGLPLDALLPILEGIREDIKEIREVYAELEIRMVGGSLLIVYEADWTRAREALKRLEDDEEQEDEEDEDDDDDDDSEKQKGPPFIVKMIDFAHTQLVPGKGPDEGVLLGMDTLLKLIDGRIAEFEKTN
ncbi:hypothetical protein H0H93_007430 [Arthromyces matolae]|nr:hypothetical protein H0H93_007430 [Arthromyces matolae]